MIGTLLATNGLMKSQSHRLYLSLKGLPKLNANAPHFSLNKILSSGLFFDILNASKIFDVRTAVTFMKRF